MIRRLLAAAGVAASLFSATVAAAPVAVAAPGDPNQVALVVDYPDGSTRSFCVTYRSGMSGADVLTVAGPSYGTGPYAGFVLKIGGQGTVPPTTAKYWAYWRGTGSGSYTYSSAGVTSTKPAAGTVEAWHWNSSSSAESPSGGTYASLCPGGFASTPAPATTPASTPTRVAAPSGSGGGAGGGSTAPGATTAPGAGESAPGSPGSSTPGGTTAPGATPSAAPSGSTSAGTSASAGGSASPDASTSVAASAVAVTEDAGGLGTGPTIGLLAVGAAVVAFGALAVVARRRRAEED